MSLESGFVWILLRKTKGKAMREENQALILKNLQLPDEAMLPMSYWQRNLYEEVKTCLEIMDGSLMMPTPQLRDKVAEACGCTTRHAYDVILLAREALGNRKPTAKLTVREDGLEMLRQAYQKAIAIPEPDKQVKAITDIVNAMARIFNLSEDEGEALNIAQYLEENEIQFTTDPKSIGIELTEKELKEMARQRRKYLKELADVEDADCEEVEGE